MKHQYSTGLSVESVAEIIARDGQERADGGRQGGRCRVDAARRRGRFDGIEGRQAARGGDSPQGFPLEASEVRSAPSGARRHQAESPGRRLDSETGIHGDDEFSR